MNRLAPQTEVELRAARQFLEEARAKGNPDEIEAVQLRIDAILDDRPRPAAVANDGEVIYDNASPWIQGQGSVAINSGPYAEPIFTPEEIAALQAQFRRDLGLEP